MSIARRTTVLCAFLGLVAVAIPAAAQECTPTGSGRTLSRRVLTELPAAAALDSAAAVLQRHGFTLRRREAGGAVVTDALSRRGESGWQRVLVRVEEKEAGRVMFCARWNPRTVRPPREIVVDSPDADFPRQLYDDISDAVAVDP